MISKDIRIILCNNVKMIRITIGKKSKPSSLTSSYALLVKNSNRLKPKIFFRIVIADILYDRSKVLHVGDA